MTTISYEKTTCGRCGGSGHFSYCQAYGTVCFGCGGSGQMRTKRGAAARKAIRGFMSEHYSRPVEDIRAGDQVRESGGWRLIVADSATSGSRFLDKETDEWVSFIQLKAKSCSYNYHPHTVIEVRPTAEQFRNEVVPFAASFKGANIDGETNDHILVIHKHTS